MASNFFRLNKGLTLAPQASEPAGTDGDVYYNSALGKFRVYQNGAWQDLVSGSGGSKNYLSTYNNNPGNGNFENNSTAGWSLFNTSLTSGKPTGGITAGAASVTTFNTISSGKLAGAYSLQTASSGAWSAGQGFISDPFTIDAEDQNKVLSFKFFYSVISGAANLNFSGTSSNTFIVYLYDVTNSAWLEPAGLYSMTQNSGVGIATGTFQTTNNSTQYRVAVLASNASAGAATLYWDDFFLGPQTSVSAPAMNDWQSYTPTVSGLGAGSGSTSGFWRRVGDSVELFVEFTKDGTPGSGTSIVTFSIPAGLVADTTKLPSNFPVVGVAPNNGLDGTLNNRKTTAALIYSNLIRIYAFTDTTSGFFEGANFRANSIVSFTALIPITGWSSNIVMSNDTDTRVVAMKVGKTTGSHTSTGTEQDITSWDAVTFDTHGSFNSSTGLYTVPVAGIYRVDGCIGFVTNATGTRYALIQKNNVTQFYSNVTEANTTASTPTVMSFSGTIQCVAGDVIKVKAFQSSGGSLAYEVAQTTNLNISRLSGPSAIAASESINMRYNNSAGTSVSNVGFNIVTFANKDFDSHNSYNTSSGVYTAPVSGKYRCSCTITFAAATYAVGDQVGVAVYKNGAVFAYGTFYTVEVAGSTTTSAIVSTTVNCVAGDTLDFRVQNTRTAGATSLNSSGAANHIELERVGN